VPGASFAAFESAAKDRHQQTKHDADNDAGDNGEIENGTSALDSNIAWETAQPVRAEPAPQGEAENEDRPSKQDEEFAKLAH
jgi:hypothetical protein